MNVRLAAGLLIAVSVIAGCSTPYDPPHIEEPGVVPLDAPVPPFIGISSLITPNVRPRVLWTHGMCSHDESWVERRAAVVNSALQGTVVAKDTSAVSSDRPYTVPVSFQTAHGAVDIRFVVWSPLTVPYKALLKPDNPASAPGGQNPYHRASLNRSLKETLMNDCLVDAVAYSGKHGDAIRAFMLGEVCSVLGGRSVNLGACDLGGADDRPIVFVAESLGSKFLFDAVRAIWNEHQQRSASAQQRLARRIASIQMIFMVANQIPLLDQASPVTQPSLDGEPALRASTRAPSIRALLSIIGQSQRRTFREAPPAEQRTIVAFSDPNDLLSYRLLPVELETREARLINVIVSNDGTLLDYVERPDNAHCGYSWNPYVIGIIVNGYDPLKPFPRVPGVADRSCLSQ